MHATVLQELPPLPFPLPPAITGPCVQENRAVRRTLQETPAPDIENNSLCGEVVVVRPDSYVHRRDNGLLYRESRLEEKPMEVDRDHDDVSETTAEDIMSLVTSEPIRSLLEALSRPWDVLSPAMSTQSLTLGLSTPALPSVAVSPFDVEIPVPRAHDDTPPTTRLDRLSQHSFPSHSTPFTCETSDSSHATSISPVTPPARHHPLFGDEQMRLKETGVYRQKQDGEDRPYWTRRSPQDMFRFTGSAASPINIFRS